MLALPRLAFPCDYNGPVDVVTLARTAPIIVSAVAGQNGELRIFSTHAGTAPATVTLGASNCRPALRPGAGYIVFLAPTPAGGYVAVGANAGAFELPDDAHARIIVEALVGRIRATGDNAALDALLPEMFASRVPPLVHDALRRVAAGGRASHETCRQLERVLIRESDERAIGMTHEAAMEVFVRRCGSR